MLPCSAPILPAAASASPQSGRPSPWCDQIGTCSGWCIRGLYITFALDTGTCTAVSVPVPVHIGLCTAMAKKITAMTDHMSNVLMTG